MNKDLLNEIKRNRTLMGLKPISNKIITETVDPKDWIKLGQKIEREIGFEDAGKMFEDLYIAMEKNAEAAYRKLRGAAFDAEEFKVWRNNFDEFAGKLDSLKNIGKKMSSKSFADLTEEEIKVLQLYRTMLNKSKNTLDDFTAAETKKIKDNLAAEATATKQSETLINETLKKAREFFEKNPTDPAKFEENMKNFISQAYKQATGGWNIKPELLEKMYEKMRREADFDDLLKKYADDATKKKYQTADEIAEEEAKRKAKQKVEDAKKELFGDKLMGPEAWYIRFTDFILGRYARGLNFLGKWWRTILSMFNVQEFTERMMTWIKKMELRGWTKFNKLNVTPEEIQKIVKEYTKTINEISIKYRNNPSLRNKLIQQKTSQLRTELAARVKPGETNDTNKEIFDVANDVIKRLETVKNTIYRELGEDSQDYKDIDELVKYMKEGTGKGGESTLTRLQEWAKFLEKCSVETGEGKTLTWLKDLLGLTYKNTDEFYENATKEISEVVEEATSKNNRIKRIAKQFWENFSSIWTKLDKDGKVMSAWKGLLYNTLGALRNKFRYGTFASWDTISRYMYRYGFVKGTITLTIRSSLIFYVYIPFFQNILASFVSMLSAIPDLFPGEDGAISSAYKATMTRIAATILGPIDAAGSLIYNLGGDSLNEYAKEYALNKDKIESLRENFGLTMFDTLTESVSENIKSFIPFYNQILSFGNMFKYDAAKDEISELMNIQVGGGIPFAVGVLQELVELKNMWQRGDSAEEMIKSLDDRQKELIDKLNKLANETTVREKFPLIDQELKVKVAERKTAVAEKWNYCNITKEQYNVMLALISTDPYFDKTLSNMKSDNTTAQVTLKQTLKKYQYSTGILLNGKFYTIALANAGILPNLKVGEDGLMTQDGMLDYTDSKVIGKGSRCFLTGGYFLYDGSEDKWYTIDAWAKTFIPNTEVGNVKEQVDEGNAYQEYQIFDKGFNEFIESWNKVLENDTQIKYWTEVLNSDEYKPKMERFLWLYNKKDFKSLRSDAQGYIDRYYQKYALMFDNLDKLSAALNEKVGNLIKQNTKQSKETLESIKKTYTENDLKFNNDPNNPDYLKIDLKADVKRKIGYQDKVQVEGIYNKKYKIINEMRSIKRQYLIEDEERFGENKFDHWYDTFTFEKYDEKNNEFKEIETDTLKHGKIKNRFSDFIKNYDGDDAFVRAVIDTHPEIVRFRYLKDQADINESYTPIGLGLILQSIREARGGEYEIFSVSRQDGNWNIVKGNFTKKEMANMVLKKEIPAEKQPKKRENGLESLKKKEYEGTSKLTSDEKEGLENLPKRIKEKLKEKMQRGWTTETPPNIFSDFYDESEIKSVFNDEIKIYKLNPTKDFFDSLEKNSSHIIVKRGFCRSLTLAKKDSDITAGQKRIVSHILSKCNHKFNNRLGLKYTAIK